jgi:hypothetical protein
MRQTIEIPADRKVHLDLVVPDTVPCGKQNVILDFPDPPPAKPDTAAKHEEFARDLAEIRRLCKGSSLSVDSFLEERWKERDLEEAEYRE